ncbi:MAG: response regulator transcription factor [Ferruginibacter sp.]|nr:response regulator transcription factor [Ferruginibacter sp.]
MTTTSLAIIEDNDKIRNYLFQLIGDAFPETEVTAYPDGEAAFEALKDEPVDMVLFDIELPGISGIECMYKLKAIHLQMQCMMLTVFDDVENIFKAIKAGATSYMLKNTPPLKIIEAITDLRNGGSPMSSQIARKVIEAFQQTGNSKNQSYHSLSRREQEIIRVLAKGFRYKEIADQLYLSQETIRTHIRNIYEKLQVNSRSEALKKAGLI